MLTCTTAFIAATVLQDKTPPHGWQLSGFGDGYFGTASPYPGHGQTRVGRLYDTRNGEIRLMTLEVDAVYSDPKSGFSAHVSPYAGDSADAYYASDTRTGFLAHYFNQLYGSYTFKDGTQVDAGKFLSYIGYGSFNSSQSDCYSPGWVGSLAEPSFLSGARVTKQLTPRLNASLYATQGWNSTVRTTQGLSFGAQAVYDLTHGQTLTGSVLSGREGSWHDQTNGGAWGGIGFAAQGVSDVTIADVVYQKNFTDITHVAVDADYVTRKGAPNNGTEYGLVVSGLLDLKKGFSLGMRLENLTDSDGILFGAPATIQSVAIDGRYQINPQSLIRLELRLDKSNVPIFNDQGGGMTDHQSTLNLAYFISF